MKKILCLAAGLLAFNLTPVFGQPSDDAKLKIPAAQTEATAKQSLTKFNLDFPGGTPAELVKAIEKATGKPLNVIVPKDYAQTVIPALKMSNVNVPQLFNAVINVSYRYADRPDHPHEVISSYGFETKDSPVSDNSIWYFFVYQAAASELPEKICRFYNLDPYLNRGFTVDDITTAIQTGWKMSGLRAGAPELNYHKETKLLIAYGEPENLEVIEQVLKALQPNPNNAFQSRLKDILKNSAPAGTQPRLYSPLLPPAPLSPPNMPTSTNLPEEKSGK